MIGINGDGDALVVGFYTKSRSKAVGTGGVCGVGRLFRFLSEKGGNAS